ncbi:helix-turn-helix transcriptional regulator [Parasphingorhabdus cellanae]|uniref:Helix-turn-helix transcriptional regulator n=1 Tax=Parasphingorhabdus cellanae TaxID=2806553 RepID=A0ABX7T8Q8_9SPHN|nr:helix-turn-helix transcriptional regulator [Parasphingorhabdus cellanae]QTD57260.1 helix-turn-helix transcriptional regulator [Parasphingorhabdus cellanae]
MAEVRAAAGLNQIDFAEQLSVPKSSYKNYERGAFDPPLSLIMQICETYAVDANWILFGKSKPSNKDLDKISDSIERAFSFLSEEGLELNAKNTNKAVAVILNLQDESGLDKSSVDPLLKKLVAE